MLIFYLQVMFKMDQAGNGMMISKKDLPKAMDMKADHYTFEKFRYMCILSGCDYLSSLPGIGLKKAQRMWQRTRQTDIRLVRNACFFVFVIARIFFQIYYHTQSYRYHLKYEESSEMRLLMVSPYFHFVFTFGGKTEKLWM